MVEIVSEGGYGSATVREIARVAGISTRAFYEHYSGKEECFLRVHRRLARGLLRQAGARTSKGRVNERLASTADAIVEWWSRDWKVTRFLLIGPYGAGAAALKQLRLVERGLGVELSRQLTPSAKEDREAVGLIADGIAAGLTAAMRSAMLNEGRPQSLDLRQQVTQWTLSCTCSSSGLKALQSAQAEVGRWDRSWSTSSSDSQEESPASPGGSDDLTLIQSAMAKLAASRHPDPLTPRRICAAAGVSRRSFNFYFSGVDACLVTTAVQRFDLAVERARAQSQSGPTPESRVFLGLMGLCDQIACDPALADLCFADTVESGEWLVRRDRLLAKGIAGLAETVGPMLPCPPEHLDASIAAVLGLLRNEVAAGRAGCVPRTAPILAYLMLAPTFGQAATLQAICDIQR